jgi:hypothetical protein
MRILQQLTIGRENADLEQMERTDASGTSTATSTNWSGYLVKGSSFTSAKGSWIVPAVVCAGVSGDQWAANWVGIDGWTSPTVEQAGTVSDCGGTIPTYYAWYEFYPTPMNLITSVPVSPGNIMSASVTYSGGKFTVTITNVTTGKSFTISEAVANAERVSAEWITEALCCGTKNSIEPLADFGTAVFGTDYTKQTGTNDATRSTNSCTILSFGTANILQISKTTSSTSPQLSACAPLSGDGTSFPCAWTK